VIVLAFCPIPIPAPAEIETLEEVPFRVNPPPPPLGPEIIIDPAPVVMVRLLPERTTVPVDVARLLAWTTLPRLIKLGTYNHQFTESGQASMEFPYPLMTTLAAPLISPDAGTTVTVFASEVVLNTPTGFPPATEGRLTVTFPPEVLTMIC
jgi:hypothetical protein